MSLASAVLLRDVAVVRRGAVALDVDSLEVAPGEFLAIIGPNGAGKSTLLGLVNGFVRPSRGKVVVLGHDASLLGGWRVRKRVALVAQMAAVDEKLPISVLETVMVGGYGRLGLFRRPSERLRKAALRHMEVTGIAHLAKRPLGQCSGGERQRAAIARALTQDPDILLLDEPTSALDWHAQRDIMHIINIINRERKLTILMVTHDLNALTHLADKVVYLDGGRVVWHGSGRLALDPDRLSKLYGTQMTVLQNDGQPVVLF